MKVNWINEKETLEKLVREGVPYERIGRQYEVSGNAVKKAAKKLGIELEQKREINPGENFSRRKKAIDSKSICPICGKKTSYLSSDLRPVFPEERLLLAALRDKKKLMVHPNVKSVLIKRKMISF